MTPVLFLSLLVGRTLFSALIWGTLFLVVAVFAFVLYGVLRAGGVDLSEAHRGR